MANENLMTLVKRFLGVSSSTTSRVLLVDAWRGAACLLMIIYHFCYDLNYFKLVHFNFYHHPFWLSFRTFIVTLFIGIAGISLHLATVQGVKIHTFIRRLVILGICAAVISLGSFLLFEQRLIFFGILHFMMLASVLAVFFCRWFWFNLISGTSLLVIGMSVQHPFFNQPFLHWIGLMTYKPSTEDYVPLLPWFGVILIGMFVGKSLHNYGYFHRQIRFFWILRLAKVGQHSLLVYMIHQPVLWSGLLVIKLSISHYFF